MQACWYPPMQGSLQLRPACRRSRSPQPTATDLLVAVACILLAAALVIKWCGVIPRFRRVHSSRRKEGPRSFGDHVFDG